MLWDCPSQCVQNQNLITYATITLIWAIIISQLKYYNNLLTGLPASSIFHVLHWPIHLQPDWSSQTLTFIQSLPLEIFNDCWLTFCKSLNYLVCHSRYPQFGSGIYFQISLLQTQNFPSFLKNSLCFSTCSYWLIIFPLSGIPSCLMAVFQHMLQ